MRVMGSMPGGASAPLVVVSRRGARSWQADFRRRSVVW
ncbi:hypothetical protein FB384_002649 [Prauserella sediminis]|uniref:Uncharacterized protein n=1 Tax=Prauserella sediminis TaxID=577680 RepID=A0A839XVA2_9PSEU|nr:hypothetical protein [Prauserella sediminis]